MAWYDLLGSVVPVSWRVFHVSKAYMRMRQFLHSGCMNAADIFRLRLSKGASYMQLGESYSTQLQLNKQPLLRPRYVGIQFHTKK